PLIFPPVPLGDGNELAVDGGLRSATPLADALAALAERRAPGDEPDDVWVLAPHAAGPVPGRPHHHWLWVALRAISVLTSAPLPERGEDPADATATPTPGVRLHVLHPREQLRGPSLDFHPGKVRAWYQDGLETARREGRGGRRAARAGAATGRVALTPPIRTTRCRGAATRPP